MAREDTRLLAVLIDADNVSAAHAEAILAEIATLGEPGLRRVYGDWSSAALSNWKKKARDLGLVMHQQSANTRGKNASDIGLVIDAMDILHGGRFDAFVLVSSDSDFTRLASRIREDGREVFGIGEARTPEALRNVCNRFIRIENIVGQAPGDTTQAPAAAGPAAGAEPAAPAKENPTRAVPLVREAMRRIDPDQNDYSLGQLGQALVQLHPDFDSRTYGSAKLSDLLRKLAPFEVVKGPNGNLYVRDRA
ncbi:NYN domain-containing protein [Albidovulum sp.]|jgi:hypothetical protein|uniref:NYN domain-containing protein n=1 Tax=Albidovulum sp. TaxID=1872424 RepID=UPI003047FC12